MGIHHVADALTGLAILRDEAVVLVLLEPDGTGGWLPDALPVTGRYDGYGGILPDGGQASVALAVERAALADWDALAGSAHRAHSRARPAAIVRWPAWERLREAGDGGRDPASDVDAVLAALRDVAGMDGPGRAANADVTALVAGWAYPGSDGSTVRLPPLAGTLGDTGAGRVVSRELGDWLAGRMTGNWPRQVLEGLYDLDRVRDGMSTLGRVLAPSRNMGQSVNPDAVFAASVGAVMDAYRLDRASTGEAVPALPPVGWAEALEGMARHLRAGGTRAPARPEGTD